MSPLKIGLIVAGLAGLPLAAMVIDWQFGLAAWPGYSPMTARSVSFDEGDSRNAVLAKLTQLYVARGSGITAGMRAGTELAPAGFLNEELERQGAKWRVRKVDGLITDIYDVS